MINSMQFERHGDKQNSPFFEEYLQRLLEERDRVGLTDMIFEIDAIMLTVDPGSSIAYVGELCLMTPYHYLVSLESESHWTHVLRIDLAYPDLIVREVKDPNIRGIFRSLNEVYPIGNRTAATWVRYCAYPTCTVLSSYRKNVNSVFSPPTRSGKWNCRVTWLSVNRRHIPITWFPILSVRPMTCASIHWA